MQCLGSPSLPVPEDDEGQFAEAQVGGDVLPKSSGEVSVRGPVVVADCLLLNREKKVMSAEGYQPGGGTGPCNTVMLSPLRMLLLS